MSHLGRPKGVDQSLSMGNIAKEVERSWLRNFAF